MKSLAEKLRNETNVNLIFNTLYSRSRELGKLLSLTDGSGKDYQKFTVVDLEDLEFIKFFDSCMSVATHNITFVAGACIANLAVRDRIDAARTALGMPTVIEAMYTDDWRIALPSELATFIRRGIELRTWMKKPEMAVSS